MADAWFLSLLVGFVEFHGSSGFVVRQRLTCLPMAPKIQEGNTGGDQGGNDCDDG